MDRKVSATLLEEEKQSEYSILPTAREVLQQVERLVRSTHFRNSKRYPALLRFIVEETLAGRGDALKERTLGVQVFGRLPAYDSNADPVVRVSAGEIRKRIAQYYQSPEHEEELRLELPVGSYTPLFSLPRQRSTPHQEQSDHASELLLDTLIAEAASELGIQSRPILQVGKGEHAEVDSTVARVLGWRRWHEKPGFWLGLLGAIVVSAIFLGNTRHQRQSQEGLSFFWRPLFDSKEAALIVIGVHSFDKEGQDTSPASSVTSSTLPQSMLSSMTRSDMVAISDLVGYSEVVNAFAQRTHPFRTQGASETTLEQLRRGPVVLIGAFNNIWTLRVASKLRFRLVRESSSVNTIQDSEHPANTWKLDSQQNALNNSSDYAIVSRFFDPDIEQYVVIAAGIGKSGTEAATEFVTSSNYLKLWMASAHLAHRENLEIVLSTQIIEGKHGPPHVLASTEW